FRAACGMKPVPKAEKIQRWLLANATSAASILDLDLRTAPSLVFDLGVGSLLLGADPRASETPALSETIFGEMKRARVRVGVGRRIARGQGFARVGTAAENGGWAPHVHFQIILDLLDLGADFPGVAYASQRAVWTSLSPDPNLLLGIPADGFPAQEADFSETL